MKWFDPLPGPHSWGASLIRVCFLILLQGARQGVLEPEGVEGQDLGDGHLGHSDGDHTHRGQSGHEGSVYSNGHHGGHDHERYEGYASPQPMSTNDFSSNLTLLLATDIESLILQPL